MRNIRFKCLSISLALISFVFGSCEKNIEEGKGTDPKLNISSYTFSKSGGTIEIYSTIGREIWIDHQTIEGQNDDEPEITYFSSCWIPSEIKGSWYHVKCIDDEKKRYTITVDKNENTNKRILPILISSYDWVNGLNKYVQE